MEKGKKRTIGQNPLDVYTPQAEAATKASKRGLKPSGTTKKEEKPEKVKKERLTVHVPVDLIDRVKNAVYWTPGLTLGGFAETAFQKELDRLEKKHGGPYEARESELKGGRPMK